MTTELPRDDKGNAIPAMALKGDDGDTVTITAATNRTAADFDGQTRVLSVYSDVDCFIRLGDATVNADTDAHFQPAGVMRHINRRGASRLAVISNGEDGNLYISELE